ncbi:MAG: GNAT family N-acetyltransferase [Actinomycetota bacterium]|nr:GNAT family N-acetyltransferase [Actinomycetota bacterium]
MAAINRDAEVTRYLNRPVDPDAVAAFYGIVTEHWDTHGFGFFAVESTELSRAGMFLGFVGIAYPSFLPALAHRPELGWRLGRAAWGRGLATEAAAAVLDLAFGPLGFNEVIAVIHPENARSQRVAAKVGMTIEDQVDNPVLGRLVDVWQLDNPTPLPARPSGSTPASR